jgi:hypothetical protein
VTIVIAVGCALHTACLLHEEVLPTAANVRKIAVIIGFATDSAASCERRSCVLSVNGAAAFLIQRNLPAVRDAPTIAKSCIIDLNRGFLFNRDRPTSIRIPGDIIEETVRHKVVDTAFRPISRCTIARIGSATNGLPWIQTPFSTHCFQECAMTMTPEHVTTLHISLSIFVR